MLPFLLEHPVEYKQVITPHVRWSPEKVGEYIEGVYIGTEEVEGPHGVYDRFLLQAGETTYWVYNASLRELYRKLNPQYAKRGSVWKIVCIHIDDWSMPNRRICTFELHAGQRLYQCA